MKKIIGLMIVFLNFTCVGVVNAQKIIAENEDAFAIKIEVGFFARNTAANRHEANRKGWLLTMNTAKAKGCTYLGGLGNFFSGDDPNTEIRGGKSISAVHDAFVWKRGNGAKLSLSESPRHLIDFFQSHVEFVGFVCSKGAPTMNSRLFMSLDNLENELRLAELID